MRMLFALLMLFCCAVAWADDGDERTQLALRLVELTDAKSGNRDEPQCNKVASDQSKAIIAAYLRNPDIFNGISPQSAYWPEVEAVHRDIIAVACASDLLAGTDAMQVKAYAAMSLPNLRAAVAFYASPAAREMKLARKKSAHDIDALTKQRSRSAALEAAKAGYVEAMRRLADKYKADPR